ncbi:MAG: hypothetical protein ABIQ18_10410 [Umezawaea sp.]
MIRRGSTAVLVTALLVTGCGVRPGGVVVGGPAPTVASAVVLYLVAGGRVTPVPRPSETTDALTLLAAGPTAAERERGLTTEVPAGAVFDGIVFDGHLADVTVSVDVTTLSPNAFDQIVCTASPGSTPVTVVGGGQSRGPGTCPAF